MNNIVRIARQIALAILAIVIFGATFLLTAKFDYEDNFCEYHKAEVVSVNHATELVKFKDENGKPWEYYSSDYKVNDKVTLVIDSKDDVIIKITRR